MFDAAEVAGRVHDLDRAALDVVLRGAPDLDQDVVTLSVNVSPRTLESPEFSSTAFLSIIRRYGMAPDRVVLEMTERETIRDPERLRTVLRASRTPGSSSPPTTSARATPGLRLLSQFRFDVVKIDLSLVQRAGPTTRASPSCVRSSRWPSGWVPARSPRGRDVRPAPDGARRSASRRGQGYLLGRPGPERDLAWVDIEALENREDVAHPDRARPGAGTGAAQPRCAPGRDRRPGRHRARAGRRDEPGRSRSRRCGAGR